MLHGTDCRIWQEQQNHRGCESYQQASPLPPAPPFSLSIFQIRCQAQQAKNSKIMVDYHSCLTLLIPQLTKWPLTTLQTEFLSISGYLSRFDAVQNCRAPVRKCRAKCANCRGSSRKCRVSCKNCRVLNTDRAAPRDNGNSALVRGRFSHKPLGAGKRNWRAVGETRTPTPNAAAPRFWVNDLEGTNTGTLLAGRPKRRGATGLIPFFLCRWKSRTPTPKRMGQPTRLATRLPRSACLRTPQPLLQPLLI